MALEPTPQRSQAMIWAVHHASSQTSLTVAISSGRSPFGMHQDFSTAHCIAVVMRRKSRAFVIIARSVNEVNGSTHSTSHHSFSLWDSRVNTSRQTK
jgi:hypothetical protein